MVCVCVCLCVSAVSVLTVHTWGQTFDKALIHCPLVQPATIVLLHLNQAEIRPVIPPEG